MLFFHSNEIWRDYPELVPGVLFADGITKNASVSARIDRFTAIAEARLASSAEGDLPEKLPTNSAPFGPLRQRAGCWTGSRPIRVLTGYAEWPRTIRPQTAGK
jgi:hypothetical protein